MTIHGRALKILAVLTALLLLICQVTADIAQQLDIPASAFTTYELPTPESGPCDVSVGPDDLLYVQEFFTDKIAQFNQHTGQWKEFDIPFTIPLLNNLTIPLPGYAKFELLACAIRTGYDGHMYFSNGAHNQLVRFNVTSGEVLVFTPPGDPLLQTLGNLEPFNDVTTAPDGVYFTQTTANALVHFNYTSHTFTTYPLPTPASNPLGVYYASDTNIWVLEFATSKLALLNRTTRDFTEIPLPQTCAQPLVVHAKTPSPSNLNSTTLWFACTTTSSITGIDLLTHEITSYPEPHAPTLTVEVAQDRRGNVWATHILQDTLGVLNPRTGNVSVVVEPNTVLDLPVVSVPSYGESGIIGSVVGQPPGQGDRDAAGDAVWYTHFGRNVLVRLGLEGVEVP